MKIIFYGTLDFGAPSLKALIYEGFNIVAVVTSPDKFKDTRNASIKAIAHDAHIPLLQPEKLKSSEFNDIIKALSPYLQIVIGYRMLPEIVWSLPQLGTINLHASLLPKYRGAAPINWALINGEIETGLSTFFIDKEIDTGNIIYQEKINITPEDTFGTLYSKMALKGVDLVLKTVNAIKNNSVVSVSQTLDVHSPAPKLFKETCVLDFNKPAREVVNFIRGLAPLPGAWTKIDGKSFKILKANPLVFTGEPVETGHIISDNKTYINIKCAHNTGIQIEEFIPEGKKLMTPKQYLNGNKIKTFTTGI